MHDNDLADDRRPIISGYYCDEFGELIADPPEIEVGPLRWDDDHDDDDTIDGDDETRWALGSE